MRLFAARGFDHVGVRDVAEAADVALSTLFKHFPTKEALVFDLDEDIEEGLVAAVRDRPSGASPLTAISDHLRRHNLGVQPAVDDAFGTIVAESPALQDYARNMLQRHETALGEAIAEACGMGADDARALGLARFALSVPDLAERHGDPDAAFTQLFTLLRKGWDAVVSDTGAAR